MDPLPPTFVKGFHKEECVRKMKYVKLGQTDIMVSRVSIGGATFCSSFYGYVLIYSHNCFNWFSSVATDNWKMSPFDDKGHNLNN